MEIRQHWSAVCEAIGFELPCRRGKDRWFGSGELVHSLASISCFGIFLARLTKQVEKYKEHERCTESKQHNKNPKRHHVRVRTN
jgi:hypothetical protein